jgi:hypothetical protein
MWKISRLGSIAASTAGCGGALNWTMISVPRFHNDLPDRR